MNKKVFSALRFLMLVLILGECYLLIMVFPSYLFTILLNILVNLGIVIIYLRQTEKNFSIKEKLNIW